MSMKIALVFCTALLLAWPGSARAHPAPFSYVDLRVDGPVVTATVVVHVIDVAHDLGTSESALLDASGLQPHAAAIAALIDRRMRVLVDGAAARFAWGAPVPLPERQAVRLAGRAASSGPPGVLALDALLFPYDPAHQTFINIYDGGSLALQSILGGGRTRLEYFPGTRQGTAAVVRRFLASGVHHILIGPDHLLFLVGLLLLGGTVRQLVVVVSAFTVAHSITLSLAAIGLVSPPTWMIEPAIALSIVYVGADNLTVKGGRDMRAWIAFAFGLIHGFGFASVLREVGLPPRALGWSLFAFNLGVEAGQLAVVVTVASALAGLRARSEAAARRLAFAGSIVVIAAGAFWFVQRVFFDGGVA
jgi:hydrogenase/urease accessory protein HupE